MTTATTTIQPSLFDQRLARRRELEAALAALDALEALAARRRDLARLVAEAPDAAGARTHLLALEDAIDAEEAGEKATTSMTQVVAEAAPNGAAVHVCEKCGHVGVRDGGPCPGCASAPAAPCVLDEPLTDADRRVIGEHEAGLSPPTAERPPEALDGLFVSPDAVRKAYCADKLSNVKKGPAAVTPVLVEGVPHVCTGLGGPDHPDGSCFAWLIPLMPLADWRPDRDGGTPSHLPAPGEGAAYLGRIVSVKGKKYVMRGNQHQRTVVWTEAKKAPAAAPTPPAAPGGAQPEAPPKVPEQQQAATKKKPPAPAQNPCPECKAEMTEEAGGFWCRKCGHGGYDAATRKAVAEAKETMALREKLGADLCLSRGPDGARCDSERGHAGGHTWRAPTDPVEEAGHKAAPPKRTDAPAHRACRICGVKEGARDFIQPTLCAACEGFEPLGRHVLLGDCRLTLWSHPDGRAVARAAPGELGTWHDAEDPADDGTTDVPSVPELLAALATLCDSGGPLEIAESCLLDDRTLVLELSPSRGAGVQKGLFGETAKGASAVEAGL